MIGKPVIRRLVGGTHWPMSDPVIATNVPRFANDPAVVPTFCQDKCQVTTCETLGLIDRPPRCDMIGLRCNDKHRDGDIVERNGPSFDLELTGRQAVL